MKTNKLNLRSIRMKEAFSGLAHGSYAVSLTAFNNTQDASGILTEAIFLDDNNTTYYFIPTVGMKIPTVDKLLKKYYIRFLLLNSENLEGDKKYTDFFYIFTYFGKFNFGSFVSVGELKNNIQDIIPSISNSSSTSFGPLTKKWIDHTINGFELYSYPDKQLIYPL